MKKEAVFKKSALLGKRVHAEIDGLVTLQDEADQVFAQTNSQLGGGSEFKETFVAKKQESVQKKLFVVSQGTSGFPDKNDLLAKKSKASFSVYQHSGIPECEAEPPSESVIWKVVSKKTWA